MTAPRVAVRLPDRPAVPDLLVLELVSAAAKDLVVERGTPTDTADAVLCVGVLPQEQDASPLLVRGGEEVVGEEAVAGLQVCTDSAPHMSSSAGYATGLQHVGCFLAPRSRPLEPRGPLDLTSCWSDGGTGTGGDGTPLLTAIRAATRVMTFPASPVVTVALGLGRPVEIVDGPDAGWPLAAEHVEQAGVREGGALLLPTSSRDAADTGAAPRVSRLLRQAAYLPF